MTVKEKAMTNEEAYERIAKMVFSDGDDAVAIGMALGCMIHSRNISKLPDCNICQRKITGCKYLPRYGEFTRINCPHYQPEQHLSPAADYADNQLLAPA
jgi:hypothetical protein